MVSLMLATHCFVVVADRRLITSASQIIVDSLQGALDESGERIRSLDSEKQKLLEERDTLLKGSKERDDRLAYLEQQLQNEEEERNILRGQMVDNTLAVQKLVEEREKVKTLQSQLEESEDQTKELQERLDGVLEYKRTIVQQSNDTLDKAKKVRR